ncbi:hypothetical protein I4U23_015852 [Adineta vaga]|nr:hypothetical protein I4U23_015852 [Adineta vaga]
MNHFLQSHYRDTIDEQLKCIICTQPYQFPIRLCCQHTFCQLCIQTWIEKNVSCPICRQQFDKNSLLTIPTDEILNNQLDQLRVRCLRCKKTNILRNRFHKHYQRCSKSRIKIVSDLLKTRWQYMQKTIRLKSPKSTVRVRNIDLNIEQSNFSARQLQNTTWNVPPQNFPETIPRVSYDNFEEIQRKRTLIFCILTIVLIICCYVLIKLKRVK